MKSIEFKVLLGLLAESAPTQRELAEAVGVSLGAVNKALTALRDDGLVDGMAVTAKGRAALEPYRVDNAIIMAAGLSSRFAPISYERPKGVLRVRGEVLIERQIRQLQEAGISDITVVVGYKKEEFFYLEDKMGVRVVVNDEYASRNNNSTLRKVRVRRGRDRGVLHGGAGPRSADRRGKAIGQPGRMDDAWARLLGSGVLPGLRRAA